MYTGKILIMKPFLLFACVTLFALITGCAQTSTKSQASASSLSDRIMPGAERMEQYLPLLKGKRVAVFANHTSVAGTSNLVDTLVKSGVTISVIFGPEHGFRGTADAGEKIDNVTDPATGIPVVSLYGKKRKPSADDLRNVDLMMFDIQDVGVRFYTYISSLQEYMESAIENNKPLIILDRPNPNGFYVDGPVLNIKFKSFVGMQPIPIVYGMTIGEYAKMLAGEKWLTGSSNTLQLTVIPCANYTHNSKYVLPVKPSPNLPEIQSIYLYPSTCFFEGTALSEGRGTDKPFQLFGHPSLPSNLASFTPRSREGAKNPKLLDKQCYGWDLSGTPEEALKKVDNKIQLKWLIEAYRLFPQKDSFFLKNNFISLLAGNDELARQIREGKSETDIRKSWEPALSEFKKTRKKYLLYPDFE
jgi:uncharacterized protein YbbC (DUF1343 family)